MNPILLKPSGNGRSQVVVNGRVWKTLSAREYYAHAGELRPKVLDAYGDWRIPAHVITTIPSADRQKATVKVRIGFDELDPRILPDMGVKVSFLRDEDPAATAAQPAVARMVVPKAAVRTSDGRTVVFVAKDDHVERRAISVGNENGDVVDVLSGVNAGERVVLEPPAAMKDGDKIKVQ